MSFFIINYNFKLIKLIYNSIIDIKLVSKKCEVFNKKKSIKT